MKKVWIISLITMILLSGCAFNPMGYAEWRPAETLTYLNVRTGPGREYKRVDTIPPGVGIHVSKDSVGVFEMWRKIQISDEEEYWICDGTVYDHYITFLD